MPVISRKAGQSIMVGDKIEIIISRIGRNGTVRIAIKAPREIDVCRQEQYQQLKKQPEKHND